MRYCIYSDKKHNDDATSIDHIIPLSLGGSDHFTVVATKQVNSLFGSEVEGDLDKDFLIKLRRVTTNTLGHSKTAPKLIIRRANTLNQPAQLIFSNDDPQNRSKVYFPRSGETKSFHELIGSEMEIGMSISDEYAILKFCAKVMLGAGYFVYNDRFVSNVDTDSLRKLLFSKTRDELLDLDFRACVRFIPVENDNLNITKILISYFEPKNTSGVVFSYSDDTLICFIFILGMFIGALNIKAQVDDLDKEGRNNLGFIIEIENRLTRKNTLIDFLQQYKIELEKLKPLLYTNDKDES